MHVGSEHVLVVEIELVLAVVLGEQLKRDLELGVGLRVEQDKLLAQLGHVVRDHLRIEEVLEGGPRVDYAVDVLQVQHEQFRLAFAEQDLDPVERLLREPKKRVGLECLADHLHAPAQRVDLEEVLLLSLVEVLLNVLLHMQVLVRLEHHDAHVVPEVQVREQLRLELLR